MVCFKPVILRLSKLSGVFFHVRYRTDYRPELPTSLELTSISESDQHNVLLENHNAIIKHYKLVQDQQDKIKEHYNVFLNEANLSAKIIINFINFLLHYFVCHCFN